MEEESLGGQEDFATEGEQVRVYSRTFKAGLLASGRFLTTCATLAILAVLARVLTVRDYATYRQTMLAYQFAAPLLMLGLPQALYYFLPGEKRRARAVLLENLLLLGGMGAVFSLFLLLGGNRLLAWRFHNPALAKTLLFLAPYPLFMLPAMALSACLMARDRVKQVAVFNVVSRACVLGVVVGVCLIWPTPAAAVLARVVAAGLVLIPALRLMLGSCREGEGRPDLGGMRAQLKYSVPLGIAGMLGAISLALDKVIVSSMCSTEEFAVYVNGAIEVPVVGIITGSVMAVIIPDMVRSYKARRTEEIVRLWQTSIAKCLALLAPMMFFILAMAPEIIRLLFSARYSASSYPFRVYALMLPLRATSFGAVLMATGHSNLVALMAAVGLLVNAALSIALVSAFGPIGAAWATCIATYIMIAFILVKIARVLQCRLPHLIQWARLSGILAAASLPAVAVVLLRAYGPQGDALRLVCSGMIFSALVAIAYHIAGILRVSDVLRTIRRGFRYVRGMEAQG